MKGFISAEPEIREWRLERDDRYLVLATDGVWDVMTSQEVCSVVESCAPDVGPQVGMDAGRGEGGKKQSGRRKYQLSIPHSVTCVFRTSDKYISITHR